MIASSLRERLGMLLLTMGGIGHVPFAPGTVGSAATVALWYVVLRFSVLPAWLLLSIVALVALVIGLFSFLSLQKLARRTEGRLDHSFIVVDEFLGMTIALFPLFLAGWGSAAGLLAFALFRLFDVAKPFPLSLIDRRNTPFSVLLDDIMAGLFAALIGSWLLLGQR